MYLHRGQLNGRDVGRVHHGFGPVGRVCQEALPLLRQPGKLLLTGVKPCVHAMLKVRGGRDFQPFLLFSKHVGKAGQT